MNMSDGSGYVVSNAGIWNNNDYISTWFLESQKRNFILFYFQFIFNFGN